MIKHAAFFGIILGLASGLPALYQANKTEIKAAFNSSSAPKPTGPITISSAKRVQHDIGRIVRIPMDARGHFNADFKMNGRRVPVLVDTGATLIAINQSTARRIGMKIGSDDFKYDVDTANGRTKAAAAYIDEVSIGKIYVRNVPALIMRDKALGSTLLGMSFLKELSNFQISDRELILEQ